MEKVLSLIIPVYNMENYLEQCLDSLIFPEAREVLEVLIVLDGSTDHSEEIARVYEENYPGVFRVIRKQNGGHGSAINEGVRLAGGKYLKVLDSDDWMNREAFRRLLGFLKNSRTDVVWTNFYWYFEKNEKISTQKRHPFRNVEYGREYSFEEIADRLFMKMHSMTIRTDVVRRTGKLLDEKCYYVDVEFVLYPVPQIKTIVFLDEFVYMYRLGRPGQSMTLTRMRKNHKNHERVLRSLLAYYDEQRKKQIPQAYLTYLEKEISSVLISHFKIYLSFPCSGKVRLALKRMDLSVRRDYPMIYRRVRSVSVWGIRLSGYLLYYPGHYFVALREKKNEL